MTTVYIVATHIASNTCAIKGIFSTRGKAEDKLSSLIKYTKPDGTQPQLIPINLDENGQVLIEGNTHSTCFRDIQEVTVPLEVRNTQGVMSVVLWGAFTSQEICKDRESLILKARSTLQVESKPIWRRKPDGTSYIADFRKTQTYTPAPNTLTRAVLPINTPCCSRIRIANKKNVVETVMAETDNPLKENYNGI